MKNIASRILLFFFTLLLAFALAETCVRVFKFGPEIMPVHRRMFILSDNQILRYEMLPNTTSSLFVINNDGLRDRAYPLNKPADVFRIACLGDSVCMGYAVQQNEPFSKRLESLLNTYFKDAPKRFEVLNFGVLGYNASQVAENLKTHVLKYQPDLILYGYCMNDPQDFSFEVEGLLSRLTQAEAKWVSGHTEQHLNWLKRSRLILLARYLIESRTAEGQRKGNTRQAATMDPAFASLRSGTFSNYFTEIHTAPDSWSRVTSAFEKMERLGQEHHLALCAVIFPVTKQLQPYPLAALHARLLNDFSAYGFRAYDLAPAFIGYEASGAGKIGLDSLHPTSEGHLLTALVILNHLLRDQLLPGLSAADFQRIRDQGTPQEKKLATLAQEDP